MMGRWFEKHSISLVFGFIGTVFFLVGAGFGWGYFAAQQNIQTAKETSLVTAAQLVDLPVDTPAAVEGRLSEQNPSYVEGLVAYTASRYQGIECDDENDDDDDGDRECHEVWQETERITPALWLDLPDGRVSMGHTNYELLNEPQVWQTTGSPVENKTLEYRGFRRGNAVFALGKVSKNDGVVLNVDFLSGGNRQDYLDSRVEEANTLLLISIVFGGFGLLFITIAIGTAIWMR